MNISHASIKSQQRRFLTVLATHSSIAYMSQKQRKRSLTDSDRAAAARLNSLWAVYKQKNPRLSQEAAAEQIGITQSAFSQYLRGTIALGVGAALKFAKLLRVHPHEIRDDIELPLEATGRRAVEVQEPASFYSVPSPEAAELADAWSALPSDRRRNYRDLIFLELAVCKHVPWLRIAAPQKRSHQDFERRIERDFAALRKKKFDN